MKEKESDPLIVQNKCFCVCVCKDTLPACWYSL
jgi:hypothetical protein